MTVSADAAVDERTPARDLAPDLLRAMLEIHSLSGDERRLASFLVSECRSLGLQATIDEAGNLVASTRGDPTRSQREMRDIVLLGHMDTVPGDVPVRLDGDRLFGRGAVDAKGPLAAFIVAGASASLPDGVRVVIIGAVEEESATSRGARAVVPRYQPGACIIGEPSGWDAVTIGYKGRLLVRYMHERTMTHSAGPALSGADELVSWWTRVRAAVASLAPANATPFHAVQATLRSVTTSSDGLMERVDAIAGFRLPPSVDPASVRDICTSCADHAAVETSGAEVAVVADRRSALVRTMTAAIRARGARPSLVLKTGTSDMNVVASPWGCPIAAYGPGDSALDHAPNEHIHISEFLRSIDVLSDALPALAAYPEFAPHR